MSHRLPDEYDHDFYDRYEPELVGPALSHPDDDFDPDDAPFDPTLGDEKEPDLPSGTLEELAEAHSWASECYGETYTEYRGERALYGDAWPGAMYELVAAGEREASLRLACDLHPDRLSHFRSWVPYWYNHLEHTPMLRKTYRVDPF